MSDRHVKVTFRPLTQWPPGREKTPAYRREDAKFKRAQGHVDDGAGGHRYVAPTRTPIETTYDELDRELYAISAHDVVVQLDVRSERELRSSDGYPLAKAVMLSPAVVLNFTRGPSVDKRVPYVFATDWFKRWEDNLRAIVLGLEGLRRLERYHVAQAGDQYRGWQALPASTSTALNVEAAAAVLANRSGFGADRVVRDRQAAQLAYRAAAAAAHPDRATGTTSDFQLVQEAKRVLEAHHGAKL